MEDICSFRFSAVLSFIHFRNMNKLADGIGSKFGRLIYSFSVFTAAYALGFYYLWKLTLVMLAVLPVVAACGGIQAKVVEV